jgi:hypothetical protein
MRLRSLPFALAVLLSLVVAAPTSAARNPYSAQGLCGAGYHRIDHHSLSDVGPDGVRRHLAEMVLMYNPSSGYNCAVTLKTYRVGKPDYVWISLQTHRAGDGDGTTNLKYFAGPAKVYARHRCILWHGGAEERVTYHHATYRLYDAWRSRWTHCT